MKDYKKKAMILYQIETVKVPIVDQNDKAHSYSEMPISKPYIASNKAYYIQLVLPELVMCKKIRHTYYCEELFLSNTRQSIVVRVQSSTTSQGK